MGSLTKALGSLALAGALSLPVVAGAADDVSMRIDALQKEVDALKAAQGAAPKAAAPKTEWLKIGGDYRFRVDSLRAKTADHYTALPRLMWQQGGMVGPDPGYPLVPAEKLKNDLLYTNRFGLNVEAKPMKDVSVKARLVMYKAFGNSDTAATSGLYFADRMGEFDGTSGHVPNNSGVVVDYAFATWNNIGGAPVWFSAGRRPSTGGIPTHLRQNADQPTTSGVPGLLVDYAFDGMTLGVAPDIDALPGAHAKVCYGRGFENGITGNGGNGLHDTDMIGVSVVPYDTEKLYVNLQWNRGMNIFDSPVMQSSTFGPTSVTADLGDIDWYGVTLMSALRAGSSKLTVFGSGGMSQSHPNGVLNGMGGGLLGQSDGLGGSDLEQRDGYGLYVGGRFDLPTKTKVGLEYNHGSKYWIPFDPAADDMWTSKLGTRGNVYEAYLIQEINAGPVNAAGGKLFCRLGYQYYDFEYTGSNNWVGTPVKIADLDKSPAYAQILTPIRYAQDIYATMEVKF
jgi:hypothetical protein